MSFMQYEKQLHELLLSVATKYNFNNDGQCHTQGLVQLDTQCVLSFTLDKQNYGWAQMQAIYHESGVSTCVMQMRVPLQSASLAYALFKGYDALRPYHMGRLIMLPRIIHLQHLQHILDLNLIDADTGYTIPA